MPRRYALASTFILAIDTPKNLLVLIANRARFSRSRCVAEANDGAAPGCPGTGGRIVASTSAHSSPHDPRLGRAETVWRT